MHMNRYHASLTSIALFLAVAASPAESSAPVTGITEPYLDVNLSASVPGIITLECCKEGQPVKKGDALMMLDQKLEELEAARRKAVMDRAKTDLDATQVLVERTKSVSREELDKKRMEYNVAAAEYAIAEEQLARRRIVAPFAGTICEISLHAGAACAPYQPLVRLVDTSRCYFVGHIEGKAASALRLDQPVRIQVEGGASPVTGTICFISPVVDPASGLARVKAVFDNPNAKIRPGLAARMSYP